MDYTSEYSTPAGVVELSNHHFLKIYDLSEVVFTFTEFFNRHYIKI